MNGLKERLRFMGDGDGPISATVHEAAARIEKLEAENAALRSRIVELECELGVNAERNAELARMAGKPVDALTTVSKPGRRKFRALLSEGGE